MSTPYVVLMPLAAVVPLICSDFRRRRVYIGWLLLLWVLSIVAAATTQPIGQMLVSTGINYLLTGLLGCCLIFYLKLRYCGIRGRVGYYAGGGDLGFMLAVAPLFVPTGYIRFLMAACLLSLIWSQGTAAGRRRSTIPFAGIAGITLFGYTLLKIICLL